MNYNYLSHHAKVFNFISFRWKTDKQVKFWHLNRLLRQHWQVSFLSLPESMTSFTKKTSRARAQRNYTGTQEKLWLTHETNFLI